MKCPKCNNDIILETKRNQDTGFLENYWFCDTHKRVDPTQQLTTDFLQQVQKILYENHLLIGKWKQIIIDVGDDE